MPHNERPKLGAKVEYCDGCRVKFGEWEEKFFTADKKKLHRKCYMIRFNERPQPPPQAA